jgi:hypothetical protein
MNTSILSYDQIKFIIWLVTMVERSGLSCEAHDEKFMVRHVSGLPLNEDVTRDIMGAVQDESNRLNVSIDASQVDGRILINLVSKAEHED